MTKASPPKPAAALATRDARLPIVAAHELLFRERRVSAALAAEWRKETASLVRHAAKKFVGFQKQDDLRKALDIVLGLMSLAVAHSTQGGNDPAGWAEVVLATPPTKLVGQAVGLIDRIHHDEKGRKYPHLFEFTLPDDSTRHLILRFVAARKNGRWSGYDAYLAEKDRMLQARAEDGLVRWFLADHSMDRASIEDAVVAEEVINAFVFRDVAGLGFRRGAKRAVSLQKDDFVKARAAYDDDKGKWMSQAKARYRSLLEKIPAELAPGLGTEDWFARRLKAGPPKVAKRTVDISQLEGVQAVYLLELGAEF